jgi:hypothetical protein
LNFFTDKGSIPTYTASPEEKGRIIVGILDCHKGRSDNAGLNEAAFGGSFSK